MSKLKEEEKKKQYGQAVTGHGPEYPGVVDASLQTNSLNAVQSGEPGSSNAVKAVKSGSSKNAMKSNVVSSGGVAQGVKQGTSMNYDANADYQSLIDAAVKAGDYKSAAMYESKRNAKIDGEGLDAQKTDLYTYDNNTDYQSLIDAAVKAGDYRSAAMYEAKRNTKIDMEGLDAQKSNLYSGVTKGYDSNTDYQALINEAIAKGDYASAARYEDIRNKKIDGDNLDWEKTDNYNLLPGVDGDTYNKIKADFKTSTDVNKADSEKDKARQNLESWVDTPEIFNSNVWNVLEQGFDVPVAVTEADAYLSSQLEKIQSGKTSYSDQVSGMMDKIMNREKFSYDVDKDPLFQQALASAMNNGQQAMYWIETSLSVPFENIEKIAPFISKFVVDIKTLNENTYKEYTKKSGDIVKENLMKLLALVGAEKIWVRVPYIPDYTSKEEQLETVKALKNMGFVDIEMFDYMTNV